MERSLFCLCFFFSKLGLNQLCNYNIRDKTCRPRCRFLGADFFLFLDVCMDLYTESDSPFTLHS